MHPVVSDLGLHCSGLPLEVTLFTLNNSIPHLSKPLKTSVGLFGVSKRCSLNGKQFLFCLHKIKGREIAVEMVLALVKVFKRLCGLNLQREVVHTCPGVRYSSEALCCTIPTHMNNREVKVMDSEEKIM